MGNLNSTPSSFELIAEKIDKLRKEVDNINFVLGIQKLSIDDRIIKLNNNKANSLCYLSTSELLSKEKDLKKTLDNLEIEFLSTVKGIKAGMFIYFIN